MCVWKIEKGARRKREKVEEEGQEVKGGSRKWHIQGVCIWQTRYQILDIRVSLLHTLRLPPEELQHQLSVANNSELPGKKSLRNKTGKTHLCISRLYSLLMNDFKAMLASIADCKSRPAWASTFLIFRGSTSEDLSCGMKMWGSRSLSSLTSLCSFHLAIEVGLTVISDSVSFFVDSSVSNWLLICQI